MTDDVILNIIVPGAPVPWMRPRRRGNQSFTAPKDRKHRLALGLAAAAGTKGPPVRGPIALGLAFFLPIPTSTPKRRRAAMIAGEECPTTSGDIDNLMKSVLDALKGIAYVDDRQVTRMLFLSKDYSDVPRTEIRIVRLTTDVQ